MNRNAFILSGAALCASAPIPAGATPLAGAIERAEEYSTGTVGVYARRLGAADSIAYNAGERFPSASTIKLLILVTLFQTIERHPEVWTHRIALTRDDFVGGSEVLDAYNPGDKIAISRLARAMIEASDNTASNVLISYLGFDRINSAAHRAGMHDTQLKRHFMDYNAIVHHSENWTTAHDMGLLLYQIERGAHEAVTTVASPLSCRHMIDILLNQEDRDKIARGLPKGIPLANKTGEIDGVRNDVGIVDPYGESPYVIAVLEKNLADFSNGVIAIRRIASAVHGALYTSKFGYAVRSKRT